MSTKSSKKKSTKLKILPADDAPRTRPPRAVQTEIPAFAQPKIPAIERAADEYVEKRDLRVGLLREEIVAKSVLTRLMHDNVDKIDHANETLAYTRGEYKVIVQKVEKLKVSIGDDDDDEDTVEVPR